MDVVEQPIVGVRLAEPERHEDDRGWLAEVFRAGNVGIEVPVRQANLSVSRAGVLRGLHFHKRQYDYWILVAGRIRVGLADLRQDSPSRGKGLALDLTEGQAVLIPPGVAHGFYALTDCRLLYLVTEYFTGRDEYSVRWDDPDLAVPWNLEAAPVLSPRDASAPRLEELDPKDLPQHL